MSFERPALTGLDDIDWAALEHAYGPAEDVPELLRQLAGDDAEAAQDAMYELWGNVWHQGSVYPATVPAVPYLVEIAAPGTSTVSAAEVLHLVGSIAESTDPRGLAEPEAVRAAVTACVEAIVPLAQDPDPQTRAAAWFALARSAPAERVRPLLLERWRVETEPALLGEALHGLMSVDREAAADHAAEILDGGHPHDPTLEVSAALAWLAAGRPLDERVRRAALAVPPEAGGLSHWPLMHDPFGSVLDLVAANHGARAAIELMAEALDAAREGPDPTATHRLLAAEALIAQYRSAPALLAAPIGRLLDAPELTGRTITTLERVGPEASGAAIRDRLLAIARGDTTDSDTGAAPFADEALACLARWRDPAVTGLLARDLADRPRALDAVAALGDGPDRLTVPFDAALFDAIVARLSDAIAAADEPEPIADNPIQAALFGGGRRDTGGERSLVRILTGWGPAAEPAVPVLTRLLAANPSDAAAALAAIGMPDAACLSALREVAEHGTGEGAGHARVTAARTIRTLTRDSGPLLDVVVELLGQHPATLGRIAYNSLQPAAAAAGELPEHARILIPHLLGALHAVPMPTPALVAHEIRINLARTLWRFTGDTEPLVRVLADTLALAGELATGTTVARAAEAATELGPRAHPLLPALESALADPLSCPAAARALLAIAPGEWATARREQLAGRLVDALTESRTTHGRNDILDRLAELAPLPALSAHRLRDLADRDERLVTDSFDGRVTEADEQARTRIRELLAE